MNNLKAVLTFGWPYLRRYWGRLTLGIFFGILFGVSNGVFIWATGTITERLTPQSATNLLTIRLNAAPIEPVSLHISAGTNISILTTNLTLSTDNWNTPQSIDIKENVKKHEHRKVGNSWAKRELRGVNARLETWTQQLNDWVKQAIDPWLPMSGGILTWQRILGGLLFLPVLAAFLSTTDYLADYCMGWVNERVINDLRIDVLTKLNTLSLDYFNRSRTGDLITRVNVDTSNLHKALKDSCGELVKSSFQCLAAIVALLVIDWKLTMFVLVFLPACIFPVMVLGKKMRRAGRHSRRQSVSQSSLLVELLAGIRVIKAFDLENHELARFRAQSRKMVHHGMKSVQAKGLTNPLIHIISMFGVGMLVVYIFSTGQTAPEMVMFLTALVLLFVPIKKLARIHITLSQAAAGVERLIETLQEQPTVREPLSPQPIHKFRSDINFENVSFSYGDKTVLHNIDLKLPRGHKLGVAGESGSGKSTLVNLLFRFYDPTSGAIKIDGLNLRDVSLSDLRQHMALVSQEIVLFDKTIAENIECGKLGASREEIMAAGRSAFAHEFIMQLPQGYETRIGERGVTLSGGQRQRIAIARAFVRNAPILVLDEATASLDSQSEAEVQVAIEKLEENRTVICIAHRLSTLATMDKVVVMNAGRIVEQGSFGELLKANGVFASMARRQGIHNDPANR